MIDVKQHERLCRYRQAVETTTPIECDEHGYDVCPICDPCTCRDKSEPERPEEGQ